MSKIAVSEMLSGIEDIIAGRVAVIPSPFESINYALMGGYRESDVSIWSGGPGANKTYVSYLHLIKCMQLEIDAAFFPLEDTRAEHLRRITACLINDWRYTSGKPDEVAAATAKLNPEILRQAATLADMIEENASFHMDQNGNLTDVNSRYMLDWILKQGRDGKRLVIVDPVSNINFDSGKEPTHSLQRKFMLELIARIKKIPTHVMLVCHLGKGENGRAGNVAGSASFERNAHNDFRMEKHELRQSRILSHGERPPVWHNRTVWLQKLRNGISGVSVALNMRNDGPVIEDLGIVIPESKPNGRR